MSYPKKQLGEIAKVTWGNTSITKSSYIKRGFLAFSATGPDGYLPQYEHSEPGIILSAIGARCGRCFKANGKWTAIKNTITITKNSKNDLDLNYLFYFLNDEKIWSQRGGGQPFIALGSARKLEVPFPPLSEQRRIATILDKADSLRHKRAETLKLLDQFLRSVFLDMFGDPVRNEKGWPIKSLNEICVDNKGEYGASVSAVEYEVSKFRYIRITDIDDGGKLVGNPVSADLSEKEAKKYYLEKDDILFARTGATVGKTYLYRRSDGPAVYAGYLIRYRPNPKIIVPEYLFAYTKTTHYKGWVRAKQKIVAQPNINANQYGSELMIPLPPMRLQQNFLNTIEMVSKNTLRQESAMEHYDQLFDSLTQRAFRGEL